MLHSGYNEVDGAEVEVVRKRIRRINIRIGADGIVHLSVPIWWATLAQGEANVTWQIRAVKSMWGCCHWRTRRITYNAELANKPRELVEYVVVHELTHLVAHNHGSQFYALMNARLPGWKVLRRQLNSRQ